MVVYDSLNIMEIVRTRFARNSSHPFFYYFISECPVLCVQLQRKLFRLPLHQQRQQIRLKENGEKKLIMKHAKENAKAIMTFIIATEC